MGHYNFAQAALRPSGAMTPSEPSNKIDRAMNDHYRSLAAGRVRNGASRWRSAAITTHEAGRGEPKSFAPIATRAGVPAGQCSQDVALASRCWCSH